MSNEAGAPAPTPQSRVASPNKSRINFVWVIPIVAALAGGWIAVTRILAEGPKITIVFHSAEGLEAGKTKIEYHGVEVGIIKEIRLSDDHSEVLVKADMTSGTESLLVEDTQFWVVRPRISGASVTGLGTLLSGAYIGLKIGTSKESERDFTALKEPPVLTEGTAGRFFELSTPDLGSLDNGTEIFFRHLKVGEVVSYELDADGQAFRVKAFVQAPYDQYVTPSTRFWHASGIDMSLGASGLDVQTESLVSILIGGVAFETPANGPVLPAAEEGASFTLFKSRALAFAPASRDPQLFEVVFSEDVRGLEPGAPVTWGGVTIGAVRSMQPQLNPKTLEFSVDVTIEVDAQGMGVQISDDGLESDRAAARKRLMDELVARGVRAQLRTGSFLTGALYVAFDRFPDAKPATVDWAHRPARLPTTPGQLEAIEKSLAGILKKVDEIPFAAIGQDLRKTIDDLDTTLLSARTALDNVNNWVEPNSVLEQELEGTLNEVNGAARSLRVLADYLERHPEALIRGKTGDKK